MTEATDNLVVVFVVSEFTVCEGGTVLGVGAAEGDAKDIAERLHVEPLNWRVGTFDDLVWVADVPGSEICEYRVERFEVVQAVRAE